MKWTLTRKQYREDGIFGLLTSEDGLVTFQTLEHAYLEDGNYTAKIKEGAHKIIPYNSPKHGCVTPLLNNPLDEGHEFEIHIGNYNTDSIGCILVGLGVGNTSSGGKMLTSSKQAFEQLMKIGISELEVSGVS